MRGLRVADGKALADAACILREGGAVVMPTDTVYGLGLYPPAAGDPSLLFRLKGRRPDKPVSWLMGSADDLDRFGRDVPAYARSLAERFWPGDLTLVVEASDEVPALFRGADGSIGLRMADHPVPAALIASLGGPLAVTSANLSGQPAPASAADLPSELTGHLLCLVQDGPTPKQASTVVSCLESQPKILRCGGISEAQIRALL